MGNAEIVKNIAFKSELLPIVGAMMGLVPLAVALALDSRVDDRQRDGAPRGGLSLALPLVLQLMFVSGLGLFLGALNVFLRDTQVILPNLLTLLLFASPIFYPLTAYPVWVRGILQLNPFYVLTECYRAPLLSGTLPPLWMMVYMSAVAAMAFFGGLWWFRRLKSFFDTKL